MTNPGEAASGVMASAEKSVSASWGASDVNVPTRDATASRMTPIAGGNGHE